MAEPLEPDDHAPLPPVPRRSAATERPANLTSRDAFASFADSIKVLADQMGNTVAEAHEDEQDRAVRRVKKFQRTGVPEGRRTDHLPPETVSDAPGTTLDDEDNGESPEDLPPGSKAKDPTERIRNIARRPTRPDAPKSRPSASAKRSPRATTIPLLVLMVCNLGMLVFGYWFGQAAASGGSPEVVAPPAVPGVSEKELQTANAALAAEKSGDVKTAQRLYNDSIAKGRVLPGAEYRLALLYNQQGDKDDASRHMIQSTSAGEFVAPILYIRAAHAGTSGNFAEASSDLEAAVHAEPFNGRYLFYQGEALRREGNPRAAINCLTQALNRAYSAEEGSLYLFKLGLAQIEAGDNDDFNMQMAKHLEQQPVTGDWLLLAAARDLDRAAYPAAVEHLKAAERALPPAMFASRVSDFFFRAHAQQPEAAPYLTRTPPSEVTEAGPSVMDPGSWSAEKGDPGTWPIVTTTTR